MSPRAAPRSLRARLVATVLVLLTAAFLVIGFATTIAARQFMIRQLDDDLRSAGQRFSRFHDQTPPPGVTPDRNDSFLGPAQEPRTLGARVVDGRVIEALVSDKGGTSWPVDPEDYGLLEAVPTNGQPTSQSLSIGTYRLSAFASPDGSLLVIGLPQARAESVVDGLILIEVIVLGVALAGAGVAGAVLVRHELRPLERVAQTAATVSALRLDRGDVELVERVPDTDPRTEVGKMGAALNLMLDNVGGALEARQDSEMRLRQFIADASHELRTPLAAIRGYAELTRRSDLAPDAEYSLVRISSQAERMTTLVEDLLLLARLDAGRPLERAPVDLTRLVLDSVSDAHAVGPDHSWRMALPDEPVSTVGDASRLTQVLTNLLANARTHTPPGTQVTVGLAPDVRTGDILLTVEDTGPGIPQALLPHVFERFARGEKSRSRAAGSTGLGLAIVHAVVTAHNGSVHVDSVPGRTTFTVRLPGGPAVDPPLRLTVAPRTAQPANPR
ncbi:cell wall metabolism sensor histidine kinase WalK [Pseudonocardia sp. N23]|uniref:sensor histidine kinase n=1 Tax=Pseudonocardia sp. N23 TaxID=1987376 RepID=UPI000BFC2D49|nr:HAMP domain-containing sensor histidine kinase [Pseudonocardia sp. N23]GAY09791.1 osmosensitive K+ channel histidine kinase KdpD [Pseudonocardia sp. N23]